MLFFLTLISIQSLSHRFYILTNHNFSVTLSNFFHFSFDYSCIYHKKKTFFYVVDQFFTVFYVLFKSFFFPLLYRLYQTFWSTSRRSLRLAEFLLLKLRRMYIFNQSLLIEIIRRIQFNLKNKQKIKLIQTFKSIVT